MKLSVLISLLFISCIQAIVIQPIPTRTADLASINTRQGTPTPAPVRFAKRDLEDTLSLYENWAADCNGDYNNAKFAVSDLNELCQVITTTVYCGNNVVKTITKTVTISKTTTATTTTKGGSGNKGNGSSGGNKNNGKKTCDDKCWSTYLWHTYGYGITVAQGFTGIVCMLIGLYFMIFGYNSFRSTLGFTGFVFFAVMTWIGLVNNEPQYGYPHNEIVYICVSVGLGLIGAFLFIFLYPIAIYFIGGLGGFFLAVYILSWKENLVIQIQVARICFIIGLGVVMAVMILLAESYCVIFCTAFTGGYLFMLGLDLFIHTGMINAFLAIFDGNPRHTNVYIIKTPTYVTLAFVAVLTLASFGWQYYWNMIARQRKFGVNIEKKEEK